MSVARSTTPLPSTRRSTVSTFSITSPASRIFGGVTKTISIASIGVATEVVLKVAADKRIGRIVHCSTESILLPKQRSSVQSTRA